MQFTVITGISGAGKTRSANVFEDLGYYCVDNMPPELMPKFAELCVQSQGKIPKAAFVTDIRSDTLFHGIIDQLKILEEMNIDYKLLFLEASDNIILKRYKETRRRHPLSALNLSISEAISKEREILAPLREKADCIVDTSNLSLSQLKERISGIFEKGHGKESMVVNTVSFGFKHGLPNDADIMFDVRCFPNPFYIEELKPFTGLDKDVKEYVFSFNQTEQFMDKLNGMLSFLLPYYIEEGKTNLVVAIGCTGGRHRSVAIAERLNQSLKEEGYFTTVIHRDINR